MSEPISPELALIDPALRSAAIAADPRLEADVVHFEPSRPIGEKLEELPAGQECRRQVSLPVGAAAYTVGAIIRVALFDLSVAVFLVVLIAAVSVLR